MHDLVLPAEETAAGALAPGLQALRRAEASRLLRVLRAEAEGARLDVAVRLGQIARTAPELVAALLLAPEVAVHLRCGRADDAVPHLALALARRRRLGAVVAIDVLPASGALCDADADLCVAPEAGARLLLSDGLCELALSRRRATIALGPGDESSATGAPLARITHPFPLVAGGVRLALHDENPLALLEAHPEKQGNTLSLGGRPVEAWRDALAGALELIARHLPGLATELSAPPGTRLVPVGFEPERHLSASYREHVGALYLTLHPRIETLAEAIVHEHQHGKLNLASWHDRLLDNPPDELVRSPVRPDPRPLIGVLLAAHAFVPVAELYRRMAAAGADVQGRLAAVLASNREALDVLAAHARPTPLGARVIAALATLHQRHQRATSGDRI